MKKSIIFIIPYLFSILIGIIVYGFALSNFSVVPDTETPIYHDYSLSLGRWGTNIIRYHIFNGLLPYYTLLVGIFFLSISAVEFSKILQINGIFKYVFILLFISFPQHAYQLAFTMQADAIGIGYFTASLAIGMFLKLNFEKKLTFYLKLTLIALLLIFTIAIYQALVFIPIVLYSLYFFTKINNPETDVKIEWKKLFQFVGVLLIASIVYALSVKLFFSSTESGYLSSYASGENTNRFKNFFLLVRDNLFGTFYYGNLPYLLAFIGILLSLFYFIIEKKRIILKSLIFIFLLISPFIISYFISNGSHPPRLYVSSTLVFSFVIVFLLAKINLKYAPQIMFVAMVIFLWNTYFVTNLFIASNKIYQHDLNLAYNINNYIKDNFKNFNPESDYVYFYGQTPLKEYEKMILPKSDVFSGSLFRWDNGNNWRIINFFRFKDIAYYRFLDDEQSFNRIKDSIPKMPAYPLEGSINKFDNVVVVKLGFTRGTLLSFEKGEEPIPLYDTNSDFKVQEFSFALTEDSNMQGGVDSFIQNGNEVSISGWVAYKYVPSDETEAFILLFNKENSFLVETNRVYRNGVSDYLGDGTNYNSCGYTTTFNVSGLPKGTYELRLRLYHEKSGKDNFKLGFNSIIVK